VCSCRLFKVLSVAVSLPSPQLILYVEILRKLAELYDDELKTFTLYGFIGLPEYIKFVTVSI
jgi:hypothetical protein